MAKLNPVSGKKMLKILQKLGFELIRIKGSHHFLCNPANRKTASVPVHANENLGLGLLKTILRDIDLAVEDFEELRRKV
ncbi:MAG: type II toxin-antitoxin system HicA family toxin [Patescibacteria group bacterium]